MPVVLRCGPTDLVRMRFGVSPLWETSHAVRLLVHPSRRSPHARWAADVAGRAADLDLSALSLLMPQPGFTPDFFSPPPTGPGTGIEDELDRVRRTPPRRVRQEIDASLASRSSGVPAPRWLLERPGAARDRLADTLRECWEVLVRPSWPVLQDVLDADIAHHARRLARGGARALLPGLDARVSWRDDDSSVRVRSGSDEARDLDGEGLLLMPSAFVWPRLVVVTDRPWQPTIVYPARGMDALWRSATLADSSALSRLVGTGRASVLLALCEPSTTSRVARALLISQPTVSEHLTVLRHAGLVTRRRSGRVVEYARTDLGDSLVRGA